MKENGGDSVTVEYAGDVALITITRPEAMNALGLSVLQSLRKSLHAVQDRQARAVVITGSGDKSFVAGADIGELQAMEAHEVREFIRSGHRVFGEIEAMGIPVIAAVNGYALGGGLELALACDIRVCSSNAKFGLPETKLGLFPAWGGTLRLPCVIGEGRAKELIMTGKILDSSEALSIGLVTGVHETPAAVREHAMALAQTLASGATSALGIAKSMIHRARSFSLEQAAAQDELAFSYCVASQDGREGMRAFIGKSKPTFTGR